LLFREVDHRIALPYLQRDQLPDDFAQVEDREGIGSLLYEGCRWDLNITVFKPQTTPKGRCRGSGIFVISNGAGAAVNTVDQLAPLGPVAGMIDLKRNFVRDKILVALRMARRSRPDLDAVLINMISGTALASEAAAALDEFLDETEDRIPVVLRFSGPRPELGDALLQDLGRRHPALNLVGATAELVQRSAELLELSPPQVPATSELAQQVERALATRARLGVVEDPARWLTPDRTLDAVFGRKAETRVGVLGFGATARFQIRSMQGLGVRVVWAVTPTAAKHRDRPVEKLGPSLPLFESVAEAVAECGKADVIVNYVPAAHTSEATLSCLDQGGRFRLMLVVAENMAYDQTVQVMDALDAAGVTYVGPNSPGVILVEEGEGGPEHFKLGSMPAHLFRTAGGLSFVGRSGTVLFDMVDRATAAGIGVRMAWAIGGDRYTGLGFQDALVMLEQDPGTRCIVIDGEAGGIQEQLAARLVATGIISKPVVAMVVGKTLPAGAVYGHPGSVKHTEADDPAVKEWHLREAGCIVVDDPTQMVRALFEIERLGWNIEERRRDALWEVLQKEGRPHGRRWLRRHRAAFELLYGWVGNWRLRRANETHAEHLHELVQHLSQLGPRGFAGLVGSCIDEESFVRGFEKSPEYVAEMVRGVSELGVANLERLLTEVLTRDSFNAALRATPWAAADIINESNEIGLSETADVLSHTIGLDLFRHSFAAKPWNTAHALRSINNMRAHRFVRAFRRIAEHLLSDAEPLSEAWMLNPWATVKLLRGYDRIPDEGLDRAVEDPATRDALVALTRSNPQGLLEVGKRAFALSQEGPQPFHRIYRRLLRRGTAEAPSVPGEVERMGAKEWVSFVETVLTREAFERAVDAHPTSSAHALRLVNDASTEAESGAQHLHRVFAEHREVFDSVPFRTAVGRNPWMALDLLRAVGRLEQVEVRRIVDYVVTQRAFDLAITEHQWGTSQALHKIADMGAKEFFEHQMILEDCTRDRQSFRLAFQKNPRDAVEIVQAAARLGAADLAELMSDSSTRWAFLKRVRLSPRNAAHVLQEVVALGADQLKRLVDRGLGRPLLNRMLEDKGPALVRLLRCVAVVGVDEFLERLRERNGRTGEEALSADNALAVAEAIKHEAVESQFSDPKRRMQLRVRGQQDLELSEVEVKGLYGSYPVYETVILKLHREEPMEPAEQVDLYHLASGRKRFRAQLIPVLSNFVPRAELEERVERGEPLVPELSRLKGLPGREGHRFDAYFHTLEVIDQLHRTVLALEFLDPDPRDAVLRHLDQTVAGVSRRHLLILTAALHDLGKVEPGKDHVVLGLEIAREVVERIRLTPAQRTLVLDVIGHHRPPKLRQVDEPWDAFCERGGLDLLYEELSGGGANAHPVETVLHYHADILGRQGDKTSARQVSRRQQVSRHLIDRCLRAGLVLA
jgi:succinyl-CoA synthetase alpha subunit